MKEYVLFLSMDSYYFNPHSIGPFLTAGLMLILGVFIYQMNRNSVFHRCFLYLCFNAFMWLISEACLFNSVRLSVSLLWMHIFYFSIIFLPATIYHFSISSTGNLEDKVFMIRLMYIEAIILSVLSLHPLLMPSLQIGIFGLQPRAEIFTFLVMLFVVSGCVVTFMNLIQNHFQLSSPTERKQVRFFMFWFLILQLTFVDFLSFYDPTIYPVGYLVFFSFGLSITLFQLRILREKERGLIVCDHQLRSKGLEVSQLSKKLRIAQLRLSESSRTASLVKLSVGILHQISQPITSLHSGVQFLKQQKPADEAYFKLIGIMEEQTGRLKDMLNDITKLITHEKIKKQTVYLNETIERLIDLLDDELKMQGVKYELDLEENGTVIFGDEICLQQAFLIILTNALQAMEAGQDQKTKELKILTQNDPKNKKVRVIFKDNGCGIKFEDQKRIFEPFFTTKPKAIGLGLANCRNLIAAHDGEIKVESQMNKGSKIIIELPIKDVF